MEINCELQLLRAVKNQRVVNIRVSVSRVHNYLSSGTELSATPDTSLKHADPNSSEGDRDARPNPTGPSSTNRRPDRTGTNFSVEPMRRCAATSPVSSALPRRRHPPGDLAPDLPQAPVPARARRLPSLDLSDRFAHCVLASQTRDAGNPSTTYHLYTSLPQTPDLVRGTLDVRPQLRLRDVPKQEAGADGSSKFTKS